MHLSTPFPYYQSISEDASGEIAYTRLVIVIKLKEGSSQYNEMDLDELKSPSGYIIMDTDYAYVLAEGLHNDILKLYQKCLGRGLLIVYDPEKNATKKWDYPMVQIQFKQTISVQIKDFTTAHFRQRVPVECLQLLNVLEMVHYSN